jgi:hypothetical protein
VRGEKDISFGNPYKISILVAQASKPVLTPLRLMRAWPFYRNLETGNRLLTDRRKLLADSQVYHLTGNVPARVMRGGSISVVSTKILTPAAAAWASSRP